TSLEGLSIEANVATDSEGGAAEAIGIGGRFFDVSFVGRHSEYSGGFIDETQIRDLAVQPLARASSLTADTSITLPYADTDVPISLHGQRSEFVDGGVRWLADAHMS